MITYNAKLKGEKSDLKSLTQLLKQHKLAFNNASKIQFGQDKNSIKVLHNEFYEAFRQKYPKIPSQVVIRGEQECLSSYRSVKSNKHKIQKSIVKENLSMRLDKRLYRKIDDTKIAITTANKRKVFEIQTYSKLSELMGEFDYKDPLVFERDGELFISLTFDIAPPELKKQKLALGVDLGIRVSAACSDGRLIVDKKFNKEKRELRYLKRKLQSKGTDSAKRKLKKLSRKEFNKNKNQAHLISNEILKTDADTIVIEDLKGIKTKKHKYQKNNAISQVPFYKLREILSYKARNQGKTCVVVKPHYTSQIDSVTGKKDGLRQGRRYYAKSGLVYDSDINAAINIAKRSKLPVSQKLLLDGQADVNQPIVGSTYKLPTLVGRS